MEIKKILTLSVMLGALSLGACTNPYDPGQRAVGGGLIGAGAGAALGGIAGGGGGALLGAGIGSLVGAGTGYVTTPQPQYEPQPQYKRYQSYPRY